MNNSVHYKGINTYYKKKETMTLNLIAVIFIIILFGAIIVGSKIYFKSFEQHKDLSEKSIEKYINVVNAVGQNRASINWQEVAAINEVLNGGKKDEVLNKIAYAFIEKNTSNEVVILSLDAVISKLQLNTDEANKIRDYLNSITDVSGYKEFVKDADKIAFIEAIKEPAIEGYKLYGIYPSITVAQAILESAWGQSELAQISNNLFGIKADGRWNGEIATIETKENYNDVIEANFRKYDSIFKSIEDHGEFLSKNSRYSESGVFKAANYTEQAQALEDAGYSTAKNEVGDKIYADKLIAVIQKYNLMGLDTEAKNRK